MTRPAFDPSNPQTWGPVLEEPADGEPPSDTPEQTTDAAIAALSKRWQKSHERDARKREKALLKDAPGARADERAILAAAARDLSLGEDLMRAQAQLCARMNALIDSPKAVLTLAKALREVIACRSATTSRAEQLLLAASTVRVQRRLANIENKPPLRRVA